MSKPEDYYIREGVLNNMTVIELLKKAKERNYGFMPTSGKASIVFYFKDAQNKELQNESQIVQQAVQARWEKERQEALELSKQPKKSTNVKNPSVDEPQPEIKILSETTLVNQLKYSNQISELDNIFNILTKGNSLESKLKFEYTRAKKDDLDLRYEDGGRNYDRDNPNKTAINYIKNLYRQAELPRKQQVSEVYQSKPRTIQSRTEQGEQKAKPTLTGQAQRILPPPSTTAQVFQSPISASVSVPDVSMFARTPSKPPPGLPEDVKITPGIGKDRAALRQATTEKQSQLDANQMEKLKQARDIIETAKAQTPRQASTETPQVFSAKDLRAASTPIPADTQATPLNTWKDTPAFVYKSATSGNDSFHSAGSGGIFSPTMLEPEPMRGSVGGRLSVTGVTTRIEPTNRQLFPDNEPPIQPVKEEQEESQPVKEEVVAEATPFTPGESFPMPTRPISELGGANVVGESSNPMRLSQFLFSETRVSTYYNDPKYAKYRGKTQYEVIDILDGEVAFANMRKEAAEKETERLVTENTALVKLHETDTDIIRQLRESYNTRIEEAESNLEKEKRDSEKIKRTVETLQTKIKESEAKRVESEQEITSLRNQVIDLETDNTKLENAYNLAANTNERLNAELTQLRLDLSSGSSATVTLEQQIQLKDKSIDILNSRLQKLEESHANTIGLKEQRIQTLEQQVEEFTENLRRVREDKSEVENSVVAAEADQANLLEINTELRQQLLQTDENMDELIIENRRLQSMLNAYREQNKNIVQSMQGSQYRDTYSQKKRTSTLRYGGSPQVAEDDENQAGPAPRDVPYINYELKRRSELLAKANLGQGDNLDDFDPRQGVEEFMFPRTNLDRTEDGRVIVGRPAQVADEKSRTKIGRFLRDLNFIIIQTAGYNEESILLQKPIAIGDEPAITNYEDVKTVLQEMDVQWTEISSDAAVAKKIVQYALGYGLNEEDGTPENTFSNVTKLKSTLKYAYKIKAFPFEYKRKDTNQTEAKLKNVSLLPQSQGRVVASDFGTIVVPGQSNYSMRREGLNYVVYSAGKRQTFGSVKDAQYFITSGGFGRKTYGPITEKIFGTPTKNLSQAIY